VLLRYLEVSLARFLQKSLYRALVVSTSCLKQTILDSVLVLLCRLAFSGPKRSGQCLLVTDGAVIIRTKASAPADYGWPRSDRGPLPSADLISAIWGYLGRR